MADQRSSASPDGDALGGPDQQSIAARLLGQIKTEAKAAAARENGKRGGRPPGIPQSEETRRKISESRKARNAKGAA